MWRGHFERGEQNAHCYSAFAHLSCSRWQQCLILSKRPQTNQARSPCALFSWGVFGFLCWDYHLRGNRPRHLLPLEHKRGGKNLEVFRAGINTRSLHFDLYLWLRDILSNPATGIETTLQFCIFLLPALLKKNNYFAMSSLTKVIDERRLSSKWFILLLFNFFRW